MKDLVGKTAFITGAASGIGLGVATRLAQAGVKVMMCDIEDEALKKALAELRRTNADVDAVTADVSLKPQLQRAAEADEVQAQGHPLGPLRAHCERPSGRRTAEECDELATPHGPTPRPRITAEV